MNSNWLTIVMLLVSFNLSAFKWSLAMLRYNFFGRPLFDRKACWPKKNDGWPKFFFYQKQYVLYGITATSELVYLFLRRVDRMENFFFRSIVNFHFGLTEKIFNLQLTERIIDRKFPTFYVPIYHYKTYITHCYAIYFQELPWKSSPSCPRF